jgi:UPF0755 protein
VARWIKAFIMLVVLGIFILAVGMGFLLILSGGNPIDFIQTSILRVALSSRQDEINTPIGTDDSPIRFTISSGETPTVIARNLVNSGLILDSDLFVNYLRVENLDTQLKTGTFFLNQTQNLPAIAQTLIDTRNSGIVFSITPGQRIEEVAESIDASGRFAFSGADFLALVAANAPLNPELATLLGIPTGASLEGFLFPNTYVLPPSITALELRDEILNTFVASVGMQVIQDANAQGYSMYQMVTMASIIERESVHSDEDVLISSVYRNRLDIDMLLQADPTVQYALNGSRGRWWVNITQADYRGVVSPYNTYLNTGLPPGAIANPSLSAIRAAVYPAESSYFFFRARCDGSNRHNFATTYDEHLANGC